MLIDFNYDTEPLPGHFPAGVGLPLLKESRLNHLGKLMFQWLYWHSLLPGRDIPGDRAARCRPPASGLLQPMMHSRKEMSTSCPPTTYRRHRCELNDEGFFADPTQWTEDMAAETRPPGGHRPAHRPALAGHQFMRSEYPSKGHRARRCGCSARPRA